MGNNNVDLATYEYDWYASKKIVGIVNPVGNTNLTKPWKSRRKFFNEVYFADQIPGYPWFNELPSNFSTKTETTSNGQIKLWRID